MAFFGSFNTLRGNKERYIEEFNIVYGDGGAAIAEKAINSGFSPEFQYPLIKRILENSLGVVCHSDYGVIKALRESDSVPIAKINQPFTVSDEIKEITASNIDKLRIKYGLKHKAPIITRFGYIFTHKRYHILFNLFKNSWENILMLSCF